MVRKGVRGAEGVTRVGAFVYTGLTYPNPPENNLSNAERRVTAGADPADPAHQTRAQPEMMRGDAPPRPPKERSLNATPGTPPESPGGGTVREMTGLHPSNVMVKKQRREPLLD